MELIDRQALRAAHGLGADCHDCKRDMKSCQYDRDYSLMDFCEWLDDAPAASPWHRVEEPPKKTAKYLVWVDVNNGVFSAYPELRTAAYNVVYERWYVDGDQRTEWIGTPRYWMPIEPPKENA